MVSHDVTRFLALLHEHTGCDFRGYAKSSIQRRIERCLAKYKLRDINQLFATLGTFPETAQELLAELTVPVTEMFRDHVFFRRLRTGVLPELRSSPVIRVWHAGCATGEEAYSCAILLQEEGLYDRSVIYATDVNPHVLATAQHGIYSARSVQRFSGNYFRAGGRGSLSDYYCASYGRVLFDPALRRNMVFARHDLTSDGAFTRAHLVFCRNVLIYFEKPLQAKVIARIDETLCDGGFLCLGQRECLPQALRSRTFQPYTTGENIYRKLPGDFSLPVPRDGLSRIGINAWRTEQHL